MKKRLIILHPFVLAVLPVLNPYARNMEALDPSVLVRPAIVLLLGVSLLFVTLWKLLKDAPRAGFITSIAIIAVLNYSYVYYFPRTVHLAGLEVNRHAILISVWIIVLIVLSSHWLWSKVRPHVITNFLNILSALYLIMPLNLILVFVFTWSQSNDILNDWKRQPDPAPGQYQLSGESRPDIYYIIVDGYARADVLDEIFGYDNSPFLDYLRERGFYVADQSYANYMQTDLSLSTSLNMQYLDDLQRVGQGSNNRAPLVDLIGHSRVRQVLADHGYQFVAFASGYMDTEIKDADVYLSSQSSPFTTFEEMVISGSMAQVLVEQGLIKLPLHGYDGHRERVQYEISRLANLSDISGPKFVFVHIVAPHPPFIFDSQGEPLDPDRAYYIGDGSFFEGKSNQYTEGYTAQLTYVNTLLRQAIDGILANSASPPIIILQSDHGSGMMLNWEAPEGTCFKERFSILNAYYMPGYQTEKLYDEISPVNSFRVIFNTYFGTQLPLQEDLSYYSPWKFPYQFTEVTEETRQECLAP